jgi:acyl carrier protein
MSHHVPTQEIILSLVIDGLRDVLTMSDRPIPAELDATTSLIGKQAVLDSLALVTLIVDLEQRIEEEYDVALTLADDRAMSQKHSPFRTVGSLSGYIETLLSEELGNG